MNLKRHKSVEEMGEITCNLKKCTNLLSHNEGSALVNAGARGSP